MTTSINLNLLKIQQNLIEKLSLQSSDNTISKGKNTISEGLPVQKLQIFRVCQIVLTLSSGIWDLKKLTWPQTDGHLGLGRNRGTQQQTFSRYQGIMDKDLNRTFIRSVQLADGGGCWRIFYWIKSLVQFYLYQRFFFWFE